MHNKIIKKMKVFCEEREEASYAVSKSTEDAGLLSEECAIMDTIALFKSKLTELELEIADGPKKRMVAGVIYRAVEPYGQPPLPKGKAFDKGVVFVTLRSNMAININGLQGFVSSGNIFLRRLSSNFLILL